MPDTHTSTLAICVTPVSATKRSPAESRCGLLHSCTGAVHKQRKHEVKQCLPRRTYNIFKKRRSVPLRASFPQSPVRRPTRHNPARPDFMIFVWGGSLRSSGQVRCDHCICLREPAACAGSWASLPPLVPCPGERAACFHDRASESLLPPPCMLLHLQLTSFS